MCLTTKSFTALRNFCTLGHLEEQPPPMVLVRGWPMQLVLGKYFSGKIGRALSWESDIDLQFCPNQAVAYIFSEARMDNGIQAAVDSLAMHATTIRSVY